MTSTVYIDLIGSRTVQQDQIQVYGKYEEDETSSSQWKDQRAELLTFTRNSEQDFSSFRILYTRNWPILDDVAMDTIDSRPFKHIIRIAARQQQRNCKQILNKETGRTGASASLMRTVFMQFQDRSCRSKKNGIDPVLTQMSSNSPEFIIAFPISTDPNHAIT